MSNCPNCNNPIDEHEAGRKTDACVAIVIMGWRPHMIADHVWVGESTNNLINKEEWLPSKNIADAWEVVEKVIQDNAMTLRWYNPDGRTSHIGVTFGFGFGNKIGAQAFTAPLAICRAALNVVAND